MSYKTLVCLYNQIQDRNKDYQEHIRDITSFCTDNLLIPRANGYFVQNAYPEVLERNTIDECLQTAADLDVEWLFLVAYGFRCHNNIFPDLCIKYAEENDYSILAHILDDKPHNQSFYQLHNQCILINIKDWKNYGSPHFGESIGGRPILIPQTIRSEENFHDDYTPYWLEKGDDIRVHTQSLHEGWNIISECLKANHKIGNFPEHLRQEKRHLYPEIGDELERALQGEDIEPSNHNQAFYLRTMDPAQFTDAVYIYNTDDMSNHIQTQEEIDTLYCVAAGFKPLSIFNDIKHTDKTRIVYYDYSISALQFRQWLVETWDGTDFPSKVEQYKNIEPTFNPIWFAGRPLSEGWKETTDYFGGEDKLKELWAEYIKLEHKYIRCSLFNDCTELYEDMNTTTGNNIIWFSNSFLTDISLRLYRYSELQRMYASFNTELNNNNNRIEQLGLKL